MQSAKTFGKILLVFYLAAIHVLAALYIWEKNGTFANDLPQLPDDETVAVNISFPTPAPIPSNTNAQAVENQSRLSENNVADFTAESETKLMIPVVGIKRGQLQDTYTDARSEGRTHNAIDIPAAEGTPVVAAADGEIVKFFDSEKGGITIYEKSAHAANIVYYYAHLQKRADGLKEKDFVRQGTVIGFVGDTGNAGSGNFHLHFSIIRLLDPQRYWEGEDINPFPHLREGFEKAQ